MKMPERNVKPSIYLAVPNNGWWRSELAVGLIDMIRTSKLKFVIEDPQITRGYPLGDVRCRIVKRFRQTSCRFLVMIDNDEVPFHDLSEIIEAMASNDEIDIVDCPALTKQNGILQWHAWSVYEKDGKKGYKSIDLDALIDPPDFLRADVVGGGCMIIKRHVLEDERMKAPFVNVLDENGEVILGEDFSFCIKAGEAGYKIFTTPKKRCEHFKCVGILGHQDTVKRTNDLSTTETIIR